MTNTLRMLAAAAALSFGLWIGGVRLFSVKDTRTYAPDPSAFANPQMGYAPDIRSSHTDGTTLRYLELTWRDWEPAEGQFAWETLREKYDFDSLRAQGVHLVLRFSCDIPGSKEHLDIPDWLYQKTGNGSWYDISYGKGYSPDYSDPTFRKAHQKALATLGKAVGTDGFVSYVELGSLGHWGEWHIKSEDGLIPMPDETVRNAYVQDYRNAFPQAKLLMRRPFRAAAEQGLGLYNDMTGVPRDTEEWLRWINEGGWYGTEKNALSPMPNFWQTAPSGGEFASSLSMRQMLETSLPRTLELVRKSHMTFIGPKTADARYSDGYDAVLGALGYRIRVESAQFEQIQDEVQLTLKLTNDGSAPFYWDWDVNIYVEKGSTGETVETVRLPLKLSTLQPGTAQTVSVTLHSLGSERILHRSHVSIGIVDPMTGKDSVRFAMRTEQQNGRAILL